ncbi:hypothetical protein DV735_g1865, partial [Chaetothyriales sp. CBS 134920]
MTIPLTAPELAAHPAFRHLEWKLPANKEGLARVGHGRRGGPFNIWYELHGTGPTRMVFIMGLGAYRTAWKRQTRYFGHQRADDYSVLIFDNRGVGKSDKPTTRYSTSEMAQDIVDLLQQIGWLDSEKQVTQAQKLNIIGVSMGGMIAQELALLLPKGTVNTLVLQSTAARLVRTAPLITHLTQRINMFLPRHLDVQLEDTARRIFSARFLEAPDTEADEPYSGGPEGGNYPTNLDRYAAGELAKRMDTAGFTPKGFTLQAWAAAWHSKSPEQIAELGYQVGRTRIAVCHGTEDQMISIQHAQMLKAELGVGIEYKIWEGAGHVLMWEEKEFDPWLEEFIHRQR